MNALQFLVERAEAIQLPRRGPFVLLGTSVARHWYCHQNRATVIGVIAGFSCWVGGLLSATALDMSKDGLTTNGRYYGPRDQGLAPANLIKLNPAFEVCDAYGLLSPYFKKEVYRCLSSAAAKGLLTAGPGGALPDPDLIQENEQTLISALDLARAFALLGTAVAAVVGVVIPGARKDPSEMAARANNLSARVALMLLPRLDALKAQSERLIRAPLRGDFLDWLGEERGAYQLCSFLEAASKRAAVVAGEAARWPSPDTDRERLSVLGELEGILEECEARLLSLERVTHGAELEWLASRLSDLTRKNWGSDGPVFEGQPELWNLLLMQATDLVKELTVVLGHPSSKHFYNGEPALQRPKLDEAVWGLQNMARYTPSELALAKFLEIMKNVEKILGRRASQTRRASPT
jgi:hypothetical protein